MNNKILLPETGLYVLSLSSLVCIQNMPGSDLG